MHYHLFALLLGLMLGWGSKSALEETQTDNHQSPPMLRTQGIKYTRPLLLCGSDSHENNTSLSSLRQNTEKLVETAQQKGVISTASIYFRNLNTGEDFSIHPDEIYSPASVQKVMMLIKILKLAEIDPSQNLLSTKRTFNLSYNSNSGATYPPNEFPQDGQEYSVEDLLNYMITYSDNISFELLFNLIGKEEFERIYQEVQIQYPDAAATSTDFITPYQISLFFRVLYNATYLSQSNSEKALALLAQTTYSQGLVKNMPPDIPVAHKFGITTTQDQSGKQTGQFHDCGIIYKPNQHYFLCIMTKSCSQNLHDVEKLIASISQQIYQSF